MTDKMTELAGRPVGRLLWQYSLPAVVGMLVMALYNVVDRIFIGQWVGPEGIAGLAITYPVMNLSTAVGVLIGVGSAARISIALGAGKQREAEELLGNTLSFTIINALIYIAVFTAILDPMLLAFGADGTTLPYAREYMLYLMPGLLLTNFAFSLNNGMRASGYPGRAMITMLIGAVSNVVLDPVFILWLDMGIAGAAIATDIAMLLSAIFVAAHFSSPSTTLRFRRGTYSPRLRLILSIVSIGAAPALVNAASCIINAIANNCLKTYGTFMDVAAMGIFITYTSLLVTIVLGICQGMQPIVGYNFGARRLHRLSRAYYLAVAAASVVTTGGALAALIWPQSLARVFTSDSALIEATARAFRTALVVFPIVGFQVISTTFFQSIGSAAKSIMVGLLRQVIFLIPLLVWLPGFMGLRGVWLSFPISDVFSTIVTLVLILITFRNINRLGREQ